MKTLFQLLLIFTICSCSQPESPKSIQLSEKWSKEKAWEWYNQYDWLVGTNFNPSSAINQLEFWQEETFDQETIDRELKWSSELGMNTHRVFLHNLLWDQDSAGFKKKLDQFLTIADKYHIKPMFVLLDDVWHPVPMLGKQPDPVPHLHNSGWVQAPGAAILGDTSRHAELEGYIKGVISHFANDSRVLAWDLYNEPDNTATQRGRTELEVKDKATYSLALLQKAVGWAREIDPSQPITAGIWNGKTAEWGTLDSLRPIQKFMISNSDVISFHTYDGDTSKVKRIISELKKYDRPLLCTEYMARTNGSTFQKIMPLFKENNIAAYNWGFVSGKTNTIYPWESWKKEFTAEPEIWFHDILRQDGSAYSQEEVDFIKEMTGMNQ